MAVAGDTLRGREHSAAAAYVAAAVKSLTEETRTLWLPTSRMREIPDVRAILESPEEVRRECILLIAGRDDGYSWADSREAVTPTVHLLRMITRKHVELTCGDIEALFAAADLKADTWWLTEKARDLSPQIERAYAGLSHDGQARARPLLERVAAGVEHAPTAVRIRKLIGADPEIRYEFIEDGDDVGPRLRALIESSPEPGEARAALLDLLAAFPGSGRPGKKWQAEAERVRDMLARPAVLSRGVLDAALDASDVEVEHTWIGARGSQETYTMTCYVTRGNEPLLCGAAKFAGVIADPALLSRLRRLAAKSVTYIGGQFGYPRSLRLANMSTEAIADAGLSASIPELLALERTIRHGTLLKQIRKAIGALATAQGVTRDELLERTVEDHGLEPDGMRRVPLSRGCALIEIAQRSSRLAYIDPEGKRRKSAPPEVKETDAAALAALRADVAAIRKTIAAERSRLDGLMSLDRLWPIEDWRSLYLNHPVTGSLTRALVWDFRQADGTNVVGIPRDPSTAVTSAGDHVKIPQNAEVRLWHPIHAAPEEVRAWRLHLLGQQLVQPVKQAFRQLYVLTPAEQQTRVYSNRFAGHIFRQVQARALTKGRGWKPVPVAWWDDGIDHGVARRTYEPFGIRAEFLFDPIVDIHPGATDLYPYCTSDQVRFFDAGNGDQVELADVPPLVFTEAMRDVDLFVGVTSIGADPEWLDRGEGRRFERYWNAFSFGDLTAAAEIRREVLEQLLPRLAIADRCTLENRYLRVRGDLRTYRIHLGSGNILMSPNDQYLCIVAAHDIRTGKLFLPFDDDPLLSLILSKAFLLADDSSITDKTITAQIKRR